MKSWILAICMLILGIAIGFLIASRLPRPIPMMFSNVGEVFIHPKPGNVIKWSHGRADQPVKFKHGISPCVQADPTPECTIAPQAVKGNYFYDCKDCPDPGIGMGGETLLPSEIAVTTILPPPYTKPPGPQIWCENGAAKGDSISGKIGESFEFYPVGEITFTASFPVTGTCSPGNTLTNASPNCTLQPAATFPQTYTIHIDGCATDGTGSLTLDTSR